ncbi:hypothetical protein LCGC14_1634760 [marine sediment metagenome]|uniref:KTSC domain-containing protein n=1 Tax=marine sediment metagenome TaxID=412755 RepID=A0A0F9L194_9ZZZZ
MDRLIVSSTNIASVGYDSSSETLEIEFHSSAVYQYINVPNPVYEAMMAAPSQGSFFNANIKNQFPYERL